MSRVYAKFDSEFCSRSARITSEPHGSICASDRKGHKHNYLASCIGAISLCCGENSNFQSPFGNTPDLRRRKSRLIYRYHFFADTFEKFFQSVAFEQHGSRIVARVKLDLGGVQHFSVDEQGRLAFSFVEKSKRADAASVNAQMLVQLVLGGEFELGCAHIACQSAHIGTFVKGQHYQIVVVALLILDVQAFAGHISLYPNDLTGFFRGYYRGMANQLIAYAQAIQIMSNLVYHVTCCEQYPAR